MRLVWNEISLAYLKNVSAGTRRQQSMKRLMTSKQRTFNKKWRTFQIQANNFNTNFNPPEPIVCPDLVVARRLALDDPFWNIGALTHPNEPWAVDQNTQQGIQAYLDITHAQDELRRISRELRQALRWALQTDEKIKRLEFQLQNGM